MAKLQIISLFIFSIFLSFYCSASSLRDYRNDVNEVYEVYEVYENIKSNIKNQLNSDARKTLKNISFTTSDSGLNAFAYKNMGNRQVTITLPKGLTRQT